VSTSVLERPSSPATGPAPLRLGALTVDPAVVLAPMAGITNPAFRTLCREFGAGLYVCEMITTRALVERNEKTLQMVRATPDEDAFSVQLYGVDPATVGRAVEMLVDEGVAGTRPAHIDLNFGCPVPKVTRKGGGSALPWRRVLLRDIVRAAVRAAGDVPVTVKTRIGIDADHVTYLDAGRIAQDEGAAAITLHGRTADQLYSGTADWAPITRLVEAVDIPVLGNGDIWEADDALRMVAETGCAGVVIGRGCLGRPWLFGDLAAAFAGETRRALPTLREVAAVMHRHATLLSAEQGELHGCTDFRKHVAWYLKGFAVGSDTRRALAMVSSLDELAELLAGIPDQPYPAAVLGVPRGRTSPPRPVALPEGWLADRDDPRPPAGAELLVSGG
jgi:nifR3 family TIM-barrel protein